MNTADLMGSGMFFIFDPNDPEKQRALFEVNQYWALFAEGAD